jgi:hypothetical protein
MEHLWENGKELGVSETIYIGLLGNWVTSPDEGRPCLGSTVLTLEGMALRIGFIKIKIHSYVTTFVITTLYIQSRQRL